LSVSNTCTSAATATNLNLYPGEQGVATGTTRFSGAQIEVGTYPTSLIVTTTTATARNADQISATVPAVPAKWCVAVTAMPEEGRAWSIAGQIFRMWSLATGADGANTALADDTVFPYVLDASSGVRQVAYTAPSSAAHRMIGCSTSGALSLSIDGALTGTASGAGAGILTTPQTTLHFGKVGNSTSYNWAGYLKNLKICSAKNPKECK
jgi:hypothetical protein